VGTFGENVEEVAMGRTTDYEPGRIEREDDDGRNQDESGRSGRSARSGRNGPSLALIAFVLVAAYAVAFFFRNSQETEVDYVFGETDAPLRWALLIAVALGVILHRLLSMWWRAMRRRRR
jgi:uncharacterized integral membrane protein